MTVGDVLQDLNFCKKVIMELQQIENNYSKSYGETNAFDDAMDIIEKYMEELKNKHVK